MTNEELNLLHYIKGLPILNKDFIYNDFQWCIKYAKENNIDFWDHAERAIGFFGMRMLIHAILVVKGLNR